MKKVTKTEKERKEIINEQELSEEDLAEVICEVNDEKSNEKKKQKVDHNTAEAKQKSKDDLIDGDLETQPSKKYIPPGYSKGSRHKGRFTSTWVQFSGGLGYAYGGADPLNYDPTTKNRFIRRVFVIVLVLLIITAFYNFCTAKLHLNFGNVYTFPNDPVLIISVPTVIVMIALNCFMALSECTRSSPATHVCLFLTFVGTCLVSGSLSGKCNTLLMMYIYITAAFVAIGLIIIANTSYDFTHWTLHIIGVGIALPFVAAFCVIAKYRIIEHMRPAYTTNMLIIFAFGALIYILIMTIMLRIILGSQAVEILEDDYTLGAFYLYTSVYDIYIKIIQIIVYRFAGEDEE